MREHLRCNLLFGLTGHFVLLKDISIFSFFHSLSLSPLIHKCTHIVLNVFPYNQTFIFLALTMLSIWRTGICHSHSTCCCLIAVLWATCGCICGVLCQEFWILLKSWIPFKRPGPFFLQKSSSGTLHVLLCNSSNVGIALISGFKVWNYLPEFRSLCDYGRRGTKCNHPMGFYSWSSSWLERGYSLPTK